MPSQACSGQRLGFEPMLEINMAHFLTNDDKYRDLIYGDDLGSDRFDTGKSSSRSSGNSPGDYRFGGARGKSVRGPLNRVNGTFRRMVEAIVNSKLRRMERELELRGVRTRDNR
jgi:hypothetical protein